MVASAREGCGCDAAHKGIRVCENVFSHLTEACVLTDPDRRIVWVNAAFEALFGYRLDEIRGKTTRVLIEPPEDGLLPVRDRTAAVAGAPLPPSVPGNYRKKSGQILRAETIDWPVTDAAGEVAGHAAVIRDMGELLGLHDVLTRLYEISSSQQLGGAEKIEAIMRTGCEHFRLPTAIVSMIRGDQYTVLYSHSTIAEVSPGTQFALADTICSRTIRADGPVAVNDTAMLPAGGGTMGCASYIGVPLIIEGERIGTLSFSSPVPSRPFGRQDIDLIKLFAAWVAQEIGLEKAQERLSQAASLDWLTRTATRQVFQSDIEASHAAFLATGERASLILFDIDHFKAVNDRFGHVAGDAVLRETAEAARAVLPPGAEIYRLGGEEFAILVPRCDPRGAVDLAERLRTAIVNCRTVVGETEVRVSASFGTATLNADIPDEQVWVQRADAALYASKNKGRDQVTCASQSNVLDLLSPDRCRAFCRS